MRILTLFLLLTLPLTASIPLQVSDKDLADKTDHLAKARVVGVIMRDGKGKEIKNPKAKTGPGLENVIYLKMIVDEVYFSTEKGVPKNLEVPLDSFMHYSLGQIQKVHSEKGQPVLLLLAGTDYQPPVAGIFRKPLDKKDWFLKRIAKRKPVSPGNFPK